MMKQKIQKIIDQNKLRKNDYEDTVEIFVSFINENIHNLIVQKFNNKEVTGLISYSDHENTTGYYSSIRINSRLLNKSIEALLKHYLNLLNQETEKYSVNKNNTKIFRGEEMVLEIVSIQPKQSIH